MVAYKYEISNKTGVSRAPDVHKESNLKLIEMSASNIKNVGT